MNRYFARAPVLYLDLMYLVMCILNTRSRSDALDILNLDACLKAVTEGWGEREVDYLIRHDLEFREDYKH
jgi:hypothetical protein